METRGKEAAVVIQPNAQQTTLLCRFDPALKLCTTPPHHTGGGPVLRSARYRVTPRAADSKTKSSRGKRRARTTGRGNGRWRKGWRALQTLEVGHQAGGVRAAPAALLDGPIARHALVLCQGAGVGIVVSHVGVAAPAAEGEHREQGLW